MKKKKILSMISAVAMAAALGVGSVAGCNNNTHVHSYNWTVDYEATCTTPGHRTGRCVGCDDVRSEEIPVDDNAHEFDKAWSIEKYPTESEEGKATRVCKYNNTHKFEATLPVITEEGTGYLSSPVTQKPSFSKPGKRHFVLSHEAGDVEFDIELPVRVSIDNFEDVIYYASDQHDQIRSNTGNYVYGDPAAGGDVRKHSFTNYFGDDYTRVHDDGNSRDFWYSHDENGDPFAISAEVQTVVINPPEDPDNIPDDWEPIMGQVKTDPRIDESATEKDLLGLSYESGGGMQATYGAEDTLLKYYEASQSSGAIRYDSDYEKLGSSATDKSFRGWFEFSRMETTHFCRYRIDFTTFSNGAIKTLNVTTKIIRRFMLANTYDGTNYGDTETLFDSDGDVIFSEIYPIVNGEEQYETNYVRDEHGDIVYKYTYVQKIDGEGNPVVDENGDPVYETDENGDPVIATDTDGNPIRTPVVGDPPIFTSGIKTKPDGTPLLDRFGNTVVRPVPLGWKEGDDRQYYYEAGDRKPDGSYYDTDHEFIAVRSVEFTQTLKAEGENVEPNPYPSESVYIHSFDVHQVVTGDNGTENVKVSAGDTIETTAGESITLAISNVQPEDTASLNYDPLRVFLKTATGEIELTYTGQNAYHTVGYFSPTNNTVLLRAMYAGELTIILRPRGGRCEFEFKLNVKPGNPTSFTAYAYMYSDAGGVERYDWAKHDYEKDDNITLYEGQSLYVRALPDAAEADYVDGRFVAATPSVFARYFEIEDNLTLDDGTKVSKITAVASTEEYDDLGVYVNLNSLLTRPSTSRPGQTEPVASARIKIKVVPAPDVSDMFTGTYRGRFSRIRIGGSLVPADVTATFVPDEGGVTGKINISVSAGSTVNCEYDFSYDAATRTLTCTKVKGGSDPTFDFEIRLNGAYKLSITHPTYVTEEGTLTETIILSR